MSGMTDDQLFGNAPLPSEAPVAPQPAASSIPPLPDEPDPVLLARTALAESDSNDPESWRNVAGVVVNRAAKSGKTIAQVLTEPGQFEAYGNGHIQGVDTTSPTFQAALQAIQPVASGQVTVPYDSFFNPKIVAQRGVKPPFDPSQGTKIGSQLFGNSYQPGGSTPASDPSAAPLTPAEQAEWISIGGGAHPRTPEAPGAKPKPIAGPELVFDPSAGVTRHMDGSVAGVGDITNTPVAAATGAAAAPGVISIDPKTLIGPGGVQFARSGQPGFFTDPSGKLYQVDEGTGGKTVTVSQAPPQAQPGVISQWLKDHPADPANYLSAFGAPTPAQASANLGPKPLIPGRFGAYANNPALLAASAGVGTGFAQGLANVGNTVNNAQAWLDRSVPGFGAFDSAVSPVQAMPTGAQAASAGLVQRLRNEQNWGGDPNYGIGKFGGEIGATLPLMAMTGGAAGAALGAVTDAAPTLAGAGEFLSGTAGGNLFLRGGSLAASGALQGAEAGAITSGGSDRPFGDQVAQGAAGGAVLGPAMGAAGSAANGIGKVAAGGGRLISNAFMPLTESGRGQIADNVIRRFASGGPTDINAAELIPGSTPTLAQATANPGIAAMERAVRDVRPNQFIARDQSNAGARIQALGQIAGTPETIEELQAARDGTALPMLRAALAGAGQADATPVVSTIDSILAGPAGQRDAVQTALNGIRSKLVSDVDLGGGHSVAQVETDPAQLYGIRQAIGDSLTPLAARTGSNAQLASRELMTVKGALDNAIDDAAPGYQDYLQTYARMSGPANAQSYLQGLNLTDAQGNVTLAKVKGALTAIQKKQQLPGVNDAKSVAPEQIGALQAIYDDLQRASNSALGKSIGSNTFQNLATHNLLAQGGVPLAAAGALIGHHPLLAPLGFAGRMVYNAQNGPILDALTSRLIDPELGARALQGAPPANQFFNGSGFRSMAKGVNDNFVPAAVIGNNQFFSQGDR